VAVLGKVPGTRDQWSDLQRHPDNERRPGIVVLRPESGLFFANADAIRNQIRAHAAQGTRTVVLDAATMPSIDVTAVTMLVELAADLRRDGIELVIARDIGAARDLLPVGPERSPIRTFPTVDAAVDAL
jgi:MFS superfamily sulfate permease-like transporter